MDIGRRSAGEVGFFRLVSDFFEVRASESPWLRRPLSLLVLQPRQLSQRAFVFINVLVRPYLDPHECEQFIVLEDLSGFILSVITNTGQMNA